ncbi:MAG: acetyl-CoA hydrolase [Rhodoferax sp.]|nr:acetyl-CoA hydrolase [Actinomycetota bacterium]
MRTLTENDLRSVLRRLPGVPRVVAGGNGATPRALLGVLDACVPTYRLFALNAHVGAVPTRPEVVHETPFVGPGVRHSPSLSYVPARLSLVPRLFTSTLVPDVVCVNVAPPHDGALSLGTEVNVLPAAIEACRARGGLVLAQVNRHVPWTYGDGRLDPDLVDYAIEADEPLDQPATAPPDDAATRIGELVAARVPDGATLQLGIGTVPDATLAGLLGRRGLRLWTEMFSDGVLELDRAGALDPEAVLTASFLLGSQQLYSWVDRNPRVQLLRTETTNAPARISEQRSMTSINTALQVDLFGQANASRIRARIHSGFGGQTDFVVGALHAVGGQALMALRSWHPRADVSTVVALVDEPVTSVQHTAILTEQGTAEMFGHDERAQAEHLIERAAHPRVREELREQAVALGLRRSGAGRPTTGRVEPSGGPAGDVGP